MDWGNVPAWVGSLLTVAAVSIALWSAAQSYRQRVQDEHRRLGTEERSRKAQARLVTADASDDLAHIIIKNQSKQLISGVRVTGFEVENDDDFKLNSNLRKQIQRLDIYSKRLLAPQEELKFPAPAGFLKNPAQSLTWMAAGGPRRKPRVVIRLTDADGNQWEKKITVQGRIDDVINAIESD
ncbi:hypothetical protein EI067_02805 [Mycobacterium paragordonae]|uniref:hypothetical protein n=1 Tax=Mycobacterium paragordonae TaxID=1389713 RepID=UPI0010619254|nr:hypothetical protein [Mycobacterium paragordonae]TDL01957.1 hypothetical protein EI067_02805 [Mycobacterium paragordonae]